MQRVQLDPVMTTKVLHAFREFVGRQEIERWSDAPTRFEVRLAAYLDGFEDAIKRAAREEDPRQMRLFD